MMKVIIHSGVARRRASPHGMVARKKVAHKNKLRKQLNKRKVCTVSCMNVRRSCKLRLSMRYEIMGRKTRSSFHSDFKYIAARSQSVGPTTTSEGSPKRQIRSGSAAPATNAASNKAQKKTPVSTPTIVERRPRPSKSVRFSIRKKAIN